MSDPTGDGQAFAARLERLRAQKGESWLAGTAGGQHRPDTAGETRPAASRRPPDPRPAEPGVAPVAGGGAVGRPTTASGGRRGVAGPLIFGGALLLTAIGLSAWATTRLVEGRMQDMTDLRTAIGGQLEAMQELAAARGAEIARLRATMAGLEAKLEELEARAATAAPTAGSAAAEETAPPAADEGPVPAESEAQADIPDTEEPLRARLPALMGEARAGPLASTGPGADLGDASRFTVVPKPSPAGAQVAVPSGRDALPALVAGEALGREPTDGSPAGDLVPASGLPAETAPAPE
jgi:hypothetical protein